MKPSDPRQWKFIDQQGTFEQADAESGSYLYLPLVNKVGMISSVTPTFNGDAKADQNSFLLLPTSVEDLHNSRSARNFWLLVDGEAWSATGGSADQTAKRFGVEAERAQLKAGLLWQSVTRTHASGLQAEVTSFVPMTTDRVELMRVILTNTGSKAVEVVPTAAIPIFGRSADNLRDHRHVTSLLHRTSCVKHGVVVQPTLSFDERGHTHNTLRYAVLGAEGDGSAPTGFFPSVEDFIGEGGTLDWPQAVVNNLPVAQGEGKAPDGYESIGGLRFKTHTLKPGNTITYVIILSILSESQDVEALLNQYGTSAKVEKHLADTRAFWKNKSDLLVFNTGDDDFDGWLKWVGIQPILRRWMGNSFLPYHDYGRGGRGWRDLWQDALALLLTEPEDVAGLLHDSFAGVRMDGSNATIIGSKPGEFKADRNNIPRVWMDHGAWPLLTVQQYIDLSGDLDFLLRDQTYFADHLSHRTKKTNQNWIPGSDTKLKTKTGKVVHGSLLEHMLVQHLAVFYNVGDHNLIRLEGADWNDALDMAADKGESVAFSALYAANLSTLAKLCLALQARGVTEIELATEIIALLNAPVSEYESIDAKHQRLEDYFTSVEGELSGIKVMVKCSDLAWDLQGKADWLITHIRRQEWVNSKDGYSWFNGYYDNLGSRVEGDHPNGVRMTLTGQVFTLMSGIANDEQVEKIVNAADRYLYDEKVGGYKLNSYFGEGVEHLGRAFGFAFGHKENGAMFSHMAVMFGNALYKRGKVEEGWKVLDGMYRQSRDFNKSHMYPGLPEYFNSRGRGMYPYLTGSASWYLLTLLTEVYGVKGRLGDLVLAPRFEDSQPDNPSVSFRFASKVIELHYQRSQNSKASRIKKLEVNGNVREVSAAEVVFKREEIAVWLEKTKITVYLED
jgi:cellobiose phosphorylase